MKSILFSLLSLLIIGSNGAFAQTKIYDSVAVQLMDRMASIIGNIGACSFTVDIAEDKPDFDYGMLTRFSHHDVTYSGNNKLMVQTRNDDGRSGIWFNGEVMHYYSFTRNHYGTLQHSGSTTLETIDYVHDKYDIDFPAADFFYPTFTDDVIAMSDRIEYMGKSDVNGQSCHRIAAKGPKAILQLWLSEDGYMLPVKAIYKTLDKQVSHYEANFSNWKLNANIPDALFDFVTPPDATPITIVAKK